MRKIKLPHKKAGCFVTPNQYLLMLLLKLKMTAEMTRKYYMEDIKICSKCDDRGFLIGTKTSASNKFKEETWKEVCPYCMPTSKYGNLQEKLKAAPQLEYKPQDNKNEDQG